MIWLGNSESPKKVPSKPNPSKICPKNCSWGPLWLQGKEGKGAKGEDASAAGLQFVTLWERKSWPSQSLVCQFEDLPWFLVSYSTPILFWWWFTVAAIATHFWWISIAKCRSLPETIATYCYHRVNKKMTATNPSTPKDCLVVTCGDHMAYTSVIAPNDSEIWQWLKRTKEYLVIELFKAKAVSCHCSIRKVLLTFRGLRCVSRCRSAPPKDGSYTSQRLFWEIS